MKEVITQHPLRNIILEFDESIDAPTFETEGLKIFYELHDRTHQLKERIQAERQVSVPFDDQLEEIAFCYKQAKSKFDHLQLMIPENPAKPRVLIQLKAFLKELDNKLDHMVPQLIEATVTFYEYDEFIIKEDAYFNDVASPYFHEIFSKYESCSVSLVSFDSDLDDFKEVLAFVKQLETKYYDEMNTIIEIYSDLNQEIDQLFALIRSSIYAHLLDE